MGFCIITLIVGIFHLGQSSKTGQFKLAAGTYIVASLLMNGYKESETAVKARFGSKHIEDGAIIQSQPLGRSSWGEHDREAVSSSTNAFWSFFFA